MRWLAARCILLFLCMASAHADTLPMERTRSEKTFTFGDVIITQTHDSMKDPQNPRFTVRVFNKKELVLQLSDAAYDAFFASANGQGFVGLSNGGWPGTAVILFDKSGRILLQAEHQYARFGYCWETSTFMKVWYDAKDPQVRFPEWLPGSEAGITLRDCHGKTIDLQETVEQAKRDAQLSLRQQINQFYGTR
ncbi:hypothetical protein ACLB1G_05250 [Oxalobacteraceae bacterium A2-2]